MITELSSKRVRDGKPVHFYRCSMCGAQTERAEVPDATDSDTPETREAGPD